MDRPGTTQAHSSDQIRRAGQTHNPTSHSASLDRRTRSEDSWVEISSQPSSSSLSSVGEDVVTAGLTIQHDPRARRRRLLRQNAPSVLGIAHRASSRGTISSQEEYEESESESDRVMTSSGEVPTIPQQHLAPRPDLSPALRSTASEDKSSSDDENRTAINYPINKDQCFTPQPNAFSHPPSAGHLRTASENVPGSYFPTQRRNSRPSTRHSLPPRTPSHLPQNILSPSLNAAAHHDEALRASLTTLQSFAVAARGLQKPDSKERPSAQPQPARGNRVEPMSFRLVSEAAMQGGAPADPAPSPPQFQEPTFKPTIRRTSTSTSASTSQQPKAEHHLASPKRRSRPLSRERRAVKKARRSSSSEDLQLVSPTLMTWIVSAGVVVFLSALSFGAGYSVGKEAGLLEAGVVPMDEPVRSCAREAGRSGLGLRRSLARSAVQV